MRCDPVRCEFCGQPLEVVWVHGHGQCRHCCTNIAPCCDGEQSTDSPAPEQNSVEGADGDRQTGST